MIAINEDLRGAAMSVATKLRASGRTVDLVLEDKRMKWAFRHAERTGAQRLVMVMPEEWAAGNVRIKELESGEESDSPWATCDHSSSRISSMVSPVPNIEATMAETQSNTASLFA
ncbi:MAG: hypothetical protein Ct9H300mP30_3400 [Methanobacteriota archaeon]|nr:MAG: hypothetical protein Ct9H300mP30_3400 [Euryarchaeota archaeon]